MSPLFSLTQPFTPRTLRSLRDTLTRFSQTVSWKGDTDPVTVRKAAVLIPFCNVNDIPGILLEVRAKSLRSHSGEISFPGGKLDTDESLVKAALRETQEELGIHPDRVDVLGEIGAPELTVRGDTRVWPFVGFVRPALSIRPISDDDPLPSIDLHAIEVSQSEVAAAFHLPLTALTAPSRMRSCLFRGRRPYTVIDVMDLVQLPEGVQAAVTAVSNEESAVGCEEGDAGNAAREGRMEVWGLTGWYLSLLMRILQH